MGIIGVGARHAVPLREESFQDSCDGFTEFDQGSDLTPCAPFPKGKGEQGL